LAAHDNLIPFYAAVPSPTIDWTLNDGLGIPIEERSADEVAYIQGQLANGELANVRVVPEGSACANPAFDVTPARLVTAIVTERGVCEPHALRRLFEEG
jgi:methylthioribose-1-phosphate isomerase